MSELPFWLAFPLGIFMTLMAGVLAFFVFVLAIIILTALVDWMTARIK